MSSINTNAAISSITERISTLRNDIAGKQLEILQLESDMLTLLRYRTVTMSALRSGQEGPRLTYMGMLLEAAKGLGKVFYKTELLNRCAELYPERYISETKSFSHAVTNLCSSRQLIKVGPSKYCLAEAYKNNKEECIFLAEQLAEERKRKRERKNETPVYGGGTVAPTNGHSTNGSSFEGNSKLAADNQYRGDGLQSLSRT